MIELLDPYSDDDSGKPVPPAPLWRHALWVVGTAAVGVFLGWTSSLFRIGPEEYGLPSALPGALWPYLAAWAATGLMVAAALRAAATRAPVYAAGRIAILLTALGTRLSLGWRPEAPVLGAMVAAALAAAGVWCALALRPGSRPAGSGSGSGVSGGAAGGQDRATGA
ncbi:hypothetical protein [Streptomyces sp. NPDC050856]|uniref:hypothetical protein n=1 Tax=Streptomyces sp. NPDC050856 TaxID=3154939 RepID=UPI0033EEBEDE